jgi:hypothetical protein
MSRSRNPQIQGDNGCTLPAICHTEVRQTEFLHVLLQRNTLRTRLGFLDEGRGRFEVFSRGRAESE